ncbi:redoxin domain-containing protein [Arcticibacterium luteifluviistationis]|uniref:Thioredoxin domain-containing protein n=1 Tax=Arcticibacterium luteifluviistationis TaxID=1784714 RepID=A0A2Z4GGD2_9BACT|nr:redoxin domain-containing protein [Arcticibacterium luteifluviistationis]AWW00297.1 hypothetical protein DJ013_19815 [Arcticibacterium luteifluviistationis]
MKRFNPILIISTIYLMWSCTGNSNTLSQDSDKIEFRKSEAMVDESFMRRWEFLLPQEGSKAKDFTLETDKAETFNLYKELKKGKPVLLINGSYTCDISRQNLPQVNQISKQFESKIKTVLIHTVEAHPKDAVSPYSLEEKIWPSKSNIRDNAEANQPLTYSDRKELTMKWKHEFDIDPEILIDAAKNDYWADYGQAPNMAFLIDADGTILSRQIFFEINHLIAKINEIVL